MCVTVSPDLGTSCPDASLHHSAVPQALPADPIPTFRAPFRKHHANAAFLG